MLSGARKSTPTEELRRPSKSFPIFKINKGFFLRRADKTIPLKGIIFLKMSCDIIHLMYGPEGNS